MQAGGGLVQHVQAAAALAALQFGGQLDALRLAAGQLGGRLPQAQVAQADLAQQAQRARHRVLLGEEVAGLLHRHAQHLGDVAAVPAHLQRRLVVAGAVATGAWRIHAGHEQQFHADEALALAGVAAPLGHVEREAPGVVAAAARIGGGGEQLAHVVEQAGVGGQVGTRRAADGLLVHLHHPLHRRQVAGQVAAGAFEDRRAFVGGWRAILLGLVPQVRQHQLGQRLGDEAGLARAGDAGDRGEHAQRNARVHPAQVVPVDAAQLQPAGGLAPVAGRRGNLVEQVAGGARLRHRAQARRDAAVEHPAAALAGVGPDVHQPLRAAHQLQVVFHHEHRVAGVAQPVQGVVQGLAVGGVQPGRRLVEHVDHAEQHGTQLRGQPQALQLAGGQARRSAVQAQVAQAQLLQRAQPRHHALGQAPRRQLLLFRERAAGLGAEVALGDGLQQRRHLVQGQLRQRAYVHPAEGHRQRLGLEPLAAARRARPALHEARHAPSHQGALGAGEGVQHVAPRTGEGAHVAGLLLALERGAGFGGGEAGVHRRRGRFLGEQNPVAVLLRQVAPGPVDVVAQGDEDVAQVLPVPGRRPGGDGLFADAQRRVRHHQRLGHLVHVAQAVAGRAGALRRVRREVLGVQQRLARRVGAGARVHHPHQAGQGGHAAHRGARVAGAALLLQRHRRRQAVDGVDVRHAHLVDQAPGIGRHRLEVAPLRLGIQGAERQRGLAGTRHAGEHHQRIARDGDIHVLEVVLARAAHFDETAGAGGAGRGLAVGHGDGLGALLARSMPEEARADRGPLSGGRPPRRRRQASR